MLNAKNCVNGMKLHRNKDVVGGSRRNNVGKL